MNDILLVINAAEARVQFVLARPAGGVGVELLCAQDWAAPSRGTEILPAALEQAFALLGLAPSCLARVACVVGPGSFTGIRLALSFAAALRRATGALLAPINYLQALAAGVPAAPGMTGARVVRVLTHARRGLLHAQDFRVHAAAPAFVMPEALCEPDMVTVDSALEGLAAYAPTPVQIVGSGWTRNVAALLPCLPAGCFPVEGADQPTPRSLLELGLRAEGAARDLEPLYLRPCDAEDNLPYIVELRGQAPAEAQARLAALLAQAPAPLAPEEGA